MAKKDGNMPYREGALGCCRVEALVSIDNRGQMVLPKEIREMAEIEPGEKLAVVIWKRQGKTYCVSLVKADSFSEPLKSMLSPMMKDIIRE